MEHEAFYIVDQWFYYLLLNPFIQFLPSKKLGIFSDFSYSTLHFAFMLVNQFLLLQFVFGSTSFLSSIEPTEKQTLLIWEHVVLNNGKGLWGFHSRLKSKHKGKSSWVGEPCMKMFSFIYNNTQLVKNDFQNTLTTS